MRTDRENFTARQRDEIKLLNMKRLGFPACDVCNVMIKGKAYQVDHIKPCSQGGKATLENGRIICLPCHAEKSGEETRVAQAADRKGRKDRGIKTIKKPWPKRADPWGRNINRVFVPREQR